MSISQRRLPYCSFLLRLSVVALLGASASAQAAEPCASACRWACPAPTA